MQPHHRSRFTPVLPRLTGCVGGAVAGTEATTGTDDLAATGSNSGGLATGAAASVGIGVALMAMRRTRRR